MGLMHAKGLGVGVISRLFLFGLLWLPGVAQADLFSVNPASNFKDSAVLRVIAKRRVSSDCWEFEDNRGRVFGFSIGDVPSGAAFLFVIPRSSERCAMLPNVEMSVFSLSRDGETVTAFRCGGPGADNVFGLLGMSIKRGVPLNDAWRPRGCDRAWSYPRNVAMNAIAALWFRNNSGYVSGAVDTPIVRQTKGRE